jgi:hypothetical protein
MDYVCWNCRRPLAGLAPPFGRHSACPACFVVLHCCRMCVHHAPRLASSCDEDRAEPPANKEVANFCDWFRPRAGGDTGGGAARDAAEAAARTRLAALFGDAAGAEGARLPGAAAAPAAPPATPAEDPLAQLKRLFSGTSSEG